MSASLEKLKALHEQLKVLRRDIQKHAGAAIAKQDLRKRAETIGALWFADYVPMLTASVGPEVLQKYGSAFGRLIKLSAPNNQKSSYVAALTF